VARVIWAGLPGGGSGAGTGERQREAVTVLPDDEASCCGCRGPALPVARPGSPFSSFPQVTCLGRPGGPVLPPLFACGMRAGGPLPC